VSETRKAVDQLIRRKPFMDSATPSIRHLCDRMTSPKPTVVKVEVEK